MWLHIALVDVNDQTPVFTQNVYAVAINENVVVGTSVAKVTAVDSDTGAGGESVHWMPSCQLYRSRLMT